MGELNHAIEVSAPLSGRLAKPEWLAPVELAFCCAPINVQAKILQRIAAGGRAQPTAKIFRRGDRFRAVVEFDADPALLIPLVVWTLTPLGHGWLP